MSIALVEDADHGFDHASCFDCWLRLHPDRCERWTIEGIFFREDPKDLSCKGGVDR